MESSVEKFEIKNHDDDDSHVNNAKQHSLLYKIVKTICIVLVWLCIGLWAEVNGATLYDLMYRTHSNYEVVSRAISMRGAGSISGALLGGGILVDKFHSKVELIVAIAVAACAGLNIAVGYCGSIELLFIIYVVEGWMEVIVNIGGQVIIMDIWLSKASGPLHLIHLGYGAGGFIAPQIVKSFISDTLPTRESAVANPKCVVKADWVNQSNGINGSDGSNLTTTAAPFIPSETVQYGFLIISAIIMAVAIIWFFYFFYERKDKPSQRQHLPEPLQRATVKEIFNLNTCLPGHPVFVFIIYVFMFFWIYFAVVGERLFAKYLYAYAREEACFDKDAATDILTAFWVSFTVGRFSGFVITNFLPMKFMIFIEGFGNLTSAVVLFFFSSNSTVLWVCVCVSGILIGPCYPSGLAWANRYIMVTATGVTVLSVAAGVSDLSFLSTIGFFVEKLGINVMTSFLLGYGIVVSVMPILMQSVACTRGDRFENEDSSTDEE